MFPAPSRFSKNGQECPSKGLLGRHAPHGDRCASCASCVLGGAFSDGAFSEGGNAASVTADADADGG